MKIIVGVETHKASHTIMVLNSSGEELDQFTIPATVQGFQNALERVEQLAGEAYWGIEGAHTYEPLTYGS